MLVGELRILVDEARGHREMAGDKLLVLGGQRLELVARGPVQGLLGDVVRNRRVLVMGANGSSIDAALLLGKITSVAVPASGLSVSRPQALIGVTT